MRISNPIALVIACFLLLASTTSAQSFNPPEDCVAYYRLDPSHFETSDAVVSFLPLAIQLGSSTGLINDSFRPLFDSLGAAAIAGAVPHSITLHNFDGNFDIEAKNNFRITNLQTVLSLETAANHRTYLQSLAQILSHYQPKKNGNDENKSGDQNPQSVIQLASGQSVGRFHLPEWEPWKSIEWASTPEAFLVALGTDAIEAHLNQLAVQPIAPPYSDHFRFTDQDSNPALQFFTCFVNFKKLHSAMPEVLAQGRPRQMLTTWKLDHARNYFLHGRMQGKYILFDITYERRADPQRIIHHRPLTLNTWPSTLKLPEPPGAFVIVIPMQFAVAYDRIISAYRATIPPPKLATFDDKMRSYRRKHRANLEAVWSGFQPFLIVSDHPRPPLPIPGAASLYFEMKGERPNPRIMQNRVEKLLETLMQSPDPEKLGQSAIRHDKKQRLYYLQLEKTGTLRLPSWGWIANRYLVAGWGPPVIETNREWLEELDR